MIVMMSNKMKMLWTTASLMAVLGLAGCASAPILPSEAHSTKTLVLEEALNGLTHGEGTVTDITGDITRFNVEIHGNWDGKVLTLAEDFNYEDGKKERKTWKLTSLGDGRFQGVREDVIGTAAVFQDANAVRLDYQVTLDTSLGKIDCRFRDLLYLEPDGTVRNTATVSKFGIRVARINLTMRPDKP
jgi:Protein of unknown function (DUF3833)